ncbi:hypothetical protein KY285_036299 [Solanum tuberosum]|nr:hypothetical protein KY285_036299 [Solanum tuberosum]
MALKVEGHQKENKSRVQSSSSSWAKNKEVWKLSPTWDNSKGAKQDFKSNFDKAKPKMDYKDLDLTHLPKDVIVSIDAKAKAKSMKNIHEKGFIRGFFGLVMPLVRVWKPFVELQHFVLEFAIGDINKNENEFEAATTQPVAVTTQPVDSQSSPVGDPEAVAPTQASTTTTATVEPEIGTPTQPTFNPTIESLVVEDDFPVLDSDQSTENSSDLDHEDLFYKGDAKYESDVHEENINLRAEKRSYQRRKRTERVPKDPEEVPVAEVGPDVGFDETKLVDKNIKGKVVGDEHVYCSYDAYSIETDSDNETRRESRRIVFDKTAEKDFVAAGPSNETGTSRAISKPRGKPRKTHITTTEAPATDGEPPRPKGRHVNPDAPPPSPRGRPRKTTNNEEPTTSTIGKGGIGIERADTIPARGRGIGIRRADTTLARGRGINIGRADTTPARGRGIGIGRVDIAPARADTTPARGKGIGIVKGRGRSNTTVQAPGRGRGFKVPLSGIEVPKRTYLHEWFENPTSYTTNAPPNPHVSPVHSQSNAVPTKRSRIVGMGVFIAENGLPTYNPGLSSNRILHTSSGQPISSADVTGTLVSNQELV